MDTERCSAAFGSPYVLRLVFQQIRACEFSFKAVRLRSGCAATPYKLDRPIVMAFRIFDELDRRYVCGIGQIAACEFLRRVVGLEIPRGRQQRIVLAYQPIIIVFVWYLIDGISHDVAFGLFERDVLTELFCLLTVAAG